MPQTFNPPDGSVVYLKIPNGPECKISPGSGITITVDEFFAAGICEIKIQGSANVVAVEYA